MLALATLLLLTAPTAEAKGKPGRKSKKTEAAAEKADTTKKEKKGYEELLKGAVTDKGMFNVHRKGTDFLFEIPDSLMGRDILIVNKISGVPYALNDAGVNKGMGYGEKIVRFRKDTLYKKVWVMTYDPRITSPEGDRITRSVRDNYRETAIEQFPIDAYGKDSASVVIKVNKVFDGSEKSFNNVFGSIGLPGSPKKDLSKIESVKSFPENIIVKSLLSTSHTEEGTTIPLTVEITSNLVLLAREPMRPRFSDDRVGYFEIGHLYFNDEQQKAEERAFINRWRLEPKPEDVERYKKGELVEPQKPIELWIDPATPPVWVPYIKKGIVEWQEAFEAAGFKNAIVAREVTPDDREFDIDDVRYSVVTYAASEMANAMGPSVIDPRSGEIIEADIIWWHNVMSILHAWIRLQTGAVDPAARGNTLPTEVMGNAVRFVSSHELGHSLGLKHNFGASYSVPVDSLRSKSYTATNGTASSIMDYARFNYVAQPEDHVPYVSPHIGPYDRFAIEWGYRWYPDEETEKRQLRALLDSHTEKIYKYGEEQSPREAVDPRSLSEDLGDNAMKSAGYGIENLKRIVPEIVEWTTTGEEGQTYKNAAKLYAGAVFQWGLYPYHVMANVGGIYLESTEVGDGQKTYTFVEKEKQKEAVQFLLDQYITYPAWLFDTSVSDYTYILKETPLGTLEQSPNAMYKNTLNYLLWDLLDNKRMVRMFENEFQNGEKAFTPVEMVDMLHKHIFKPTMAGKKLDVMTRNLQKSFVDALITAAAEEEGVKINKRLHAPLPALNTTALPCNAHGCSSAMSGDNRNARLIDMYSTQINRVSDAISVKRGELMSILQLLKNKRNISDPATRFHYEDMILRIQTALGLTK